MASEPKKPMEQMLEALAKARRAQFGGEPRMPNPMRARLHEEIERTESAENEETESRPSWITMFWPRLTVAAALATLLVLVPAIWWNQSHQVAESGGLAVRDRTAAASDALNPAVPAKDTLANAPTISATEATVNLADSHQVKIGTDIAPSESEASESATHVAQGRAATESRSQETKRFDQIASAKIQGAPVAAPAAGADSKGKTDSLAAAAPPASLSSSAAGLGSVQQFSQQSAVQSFRNNARQVSRAANVLNKFQVEQQGNEIRVLDADGSTYSGTIGQPAKTGEIDSRMVDRGRVAKQTPRFAAKAVSTEKSTAPQSYFRATGYNLTLKRTLVFEGNYEAPLPQQPSKPASNDKERAEQRADRARIVGTVRVNGDAPVEVDATAETAEPMKTKSEK